MNAPISEHEVNLTFGTGSDTAGSDGITAKLIDNADRDEMKKCLNFLWNSLWTHGTFVKVWKEEDRTVLPKIGKDDYHECNAYRTVSITSCFGKRFEHITCQSLISVLEQVRFDQQQFAYLRNHSTTHALLVLVEKIKSGLLVGKKAGVVFFDFADAFGSVDRDRLLVKVGRDFGISGKLFLHIRSFLSDRFARVSK